MNFELIIESNVFIHILKLLKLDEFLFLASLNKRINKSMKIFVKCNKYSFLEWMKLQPNQEEAEESSVSLSSILFDDKNAEFLTDRAPRKNLIRNKWVDLGNELVENFKNASFQGGIERGWINQTAYKNGVWEEWKRFPLIKRVYFTTPQSHLFIFSTTLMSCELNIKNQYQVFEAEGIWMKKLNIIMNIAN